jgi:hypothetical protein
MISADVYAGKCRENLLMNGKKWEDRSGQSSVGSLQSAWCWLLIADFRLQIVECRLLPAADCRLRTAKKSEPICSPSQVRSDSSEPICSPSQVHSDSSEPLCAPSQVRSDSSEPNCSPSQVHFDSSEPVCASSQVHSD